MNQIVLFPDRVIGESQVGQPVVSEQLPAIEHESGFH
ncbi:hypothetical protein SAMN05444682_1061, partial [Parapedobacter indicus]